MTSDHLHKRSLFIALVFGVLAFPVVLHAVHAEPIGLSILDAIRIGAPGDVETFQGTITNNTGTALDSTDLFLNFSGYDPANVTLDQLLGLTSFSIPDGATSGVVDLFTFALASTAVVPATYSADVVLESFDGDFSPVQTVRVSTIVGTIPEPGSLGLAATGLLALLLYALRSRFSLLQPIMAIVALAPTLANAQVSAVQFLTSRPGLAMLDQTLLVALPITNNGSLDANNVKITGVSLRTAPLVSPSSFPVTLGDIAANSGAIFQANFNAASLVPNTPYLLTVRGTYEVRGATAGFTVNRYVGLPSSPGPGTAKSITIHSNTVSGASFLHQESVFGTEVNDEFAVPVPTGSFIQSTLTFFSTSVEPAPVAPAIVPAQGGDVAFLLNNGFGAAYGNAAEPSGATGGGVVFIAANGSIAGKPSVIAAYSTDGGASWIRRQFSGTTKLGTAAIRLCNMRRASIASSGSCRAWAAT